MSWACDNMLSWKRSLGFIFLGRISTSLKMLTLIRLVVFALVGFSPVDTVPRPTPNRMSHSKSSPEEQTVISKPSGTSLHSRLPNWYHGSYTFIGDISTQKAATRNEELSKSSAPFCSLKRTYHKSSYASSSPSAVVMNEANREVSRQRWKRCPVPSQARGHFGRYSSFNKALRSILWC